MMEVEDKIPPKVRAKVLWDAGFRTPDSLFRRGKINPRTAERYIKDFREGLSSERRPYTPREKPKQTPQIIKKVIQKARNTDKAESLRTLGTSSKVSHTQVKIILDQNGFTYKKNQKKILLTEERKAKRVKYAEEMLDREHDWPFTVFTDEASFWLSKSEPNYRWTDESMEIKGRGTHGPKIHVWGGITARGPLKLEVFESNLIAEDYIKIVKRKVKEMDDIYPEGWIWQQDGSGVHRANLVKDFLNSVENTLDFPAYSPDLSPIENIWGWLKNEVNREMPKTVDSLKRCIRKHWRRLSVDFLAPYFESLPKRMHMIIENNGNKIKY